MEAEANSLFENWKKWTTAAAATAGSLAIAGLITAFIPFIGWGVTAALEIGAVTAGATMGAEAAKARSEYDRKEEEIHNAQGELAELLLGGGQLAPQIKKLKDVLPYIDSLKNVTQRLEAFWNIRLVNLQQMRDQFAKAKEHPDSASFKFRIELIHREWMDLIPDLMAVYIDAFAPLHLRVWPGPENERQYIDFGPNPARGHNMSVDTSRAHWDTNYGKWVLDHKTPTLNFDFTLGSTSNVVLRMRHLTSQSSQSFAPIDVSINGKGFKSNYDCKSVWDSTDFVEDNWSLPAEFIKVGGNHLTINFNRAGKTRYWIAFLEILH